MRKHLALLLAALLSACCVALVACGGGSAASGTSAASGESGSAASASASASAVDTASVTEGTWQCTGVVSESDGKTYELNEVMNGYAMSIHFFGEDEVRVYVDSNFTIMNWTLEGDDLTFSGEGTYHLAVQDNGEKLVWENFQDTGYDLEFQKGDA